MVSTRRMVRQNSSKLASRTVQASQQELVSKPSPLETSMVVSPASSTNFTPRSLANSRSGSSNSKRLSYVPHVSSPRHVSNSALKLQGNGSESSRRRLSFEPTRSASAASSPPLGQVAQNSQDGSTSSHFKVQERRAFRSLSYEPKNGRGMLASTSPSSFSTNAGSPGARVSDELEALKLSNQIKEDQLRTLHQKLYRIEQGLGSIDEERTILEEKCTVLQAEKDQVQRQLRLREKEITALTKRCASQEEKMKETNQLRSQNRELTEALDDLESTLKSQEQEQDNLVSLRKQLQESELAHEDLQRQLAKITREHDAIADTLRECLANVKQLTDEKQQIEEEKRRERKRAELELEKQRLDHVRKSNDLKDELEEQQNRIHQMERILQENMATNTALRRERATMTNGQQDEIQRVVDQYENKLLSLETEVHESLLSMEKDCDKKLEQVHFEMDEKDNMLLQLEMEFTTQMEELMLQSTELEKLQDDKKELEARVSSFQELEAEHSALVDFLEVADKNLVEVTSENAYLCVEKDNLYAETSELQRKIQGLEQQIKRFHQNRKARERDFRDLIEAEQDELRIELGAKLNEALEKTQSLGMDLDSRNRIISWMENELKITRRNVVEQDCRLRRANNQGADRDKSSEADIESSDVNYVLWQQELDDAQELLAQREDRVQEVESELEKKEYMLVELESTLTVIKEKVTTLEAKVVSESKCSSSLRQELDAARTLLDEEQNRLTLLKGELSEKEVALSILESYLKDANAKVENLEETMSSGERISSSLERDLEFARTAVAEKELQIERLEAKYCEKEAAQLQLESDLANANTKIKSLEEKLVSVEKSIQEHSPEAFAEKQNLIDAMEEESAKKDELISKTEAILHSTEGKVASLENDVSRWNEEYSLLKGEMENSLESVRQRENEIHSIQLDSIKFAEKVSSLEEKLELEKSKCMSLEKDLFTERELLTETECRLQILEDENSDKTKLYSTLESTLAEANKNVALLEKQLTCDQENVGSLQTELNGARQSLLEKETLVQKLEKQCAKAEDAASQLHRDLADSRATVASLETKSEGWNVREISLTEKVSSLEEQLETTRSSLMAREDTEQHGEAMEQLDSTLQGALDSSKERLASMEGELGSWKEKYASLEQKLENASESLGERDSRIEALESANTEREEQLAELEKTIEESHEEIFLLENELVNRESTISAQEKEIADLKAVLAERRTDELASGGTEFHESQEKLENELRGARNKIVYLEQRFTNREDALMKAVADIETSAVLEEQKYRELEVKVAELEKLLEAKENELVSLHGELGMTKGRLVDREEKASMEEQNDGELKERVAELEKLLLSLDGELGMTKGQVVDRDERLRDLKAVMERKSGIEEHKCRELEEKVVKLETLLETKETRLLSLDEELGRAKQNILEGEEKARKEVQSSEKSEEKVAKLAALLDTKENQMRSLDEELEALIQSITAERESKSKMEQQKQGEFEARIADLMAMLEAKENKLFSLDGELVTTKEELIEREAKARMDEERYEKLEESIMKLKTLVEVKENQLLSLDREIGATKEQLADRENKLRRVVGEIESNERIGKQKHKEAEEKTLELQRLLKVNDEELEMTRGDLAQKEIKLKSALVRCDQERVAFEERIAEANSRVASLGELVQNRDHRLVSLEQELKETRQSLIDKETRVQSMETELEDSRAASEEVATQIRKMKTEIALKDDEIRDLQLFELQDSKETISLLEDKISLLKLEMQANETSSSNLAIELESQVKELKTRASYLEQEKADLTQEKADLTRRHDENVRSLEKQVSLLQIESSRWESQHVEQELHLEEQRAAVVSLTEQITEVHGMKEALQTTEKKVYELEKSLDQRGNLLADMVHHNKSLESVLQEQRYKVLELEESLSRSQCELAEKENEFARREMAETNLAALQLRMETLTKGQKDIAKENKELKEKVQRQEGHMLRRLQREKVLRERNNGSVTKSPAKTPTRRINSLHATPGPEKTPTRRIQSLNTISMGSRFTEGLPSGRSQLRTPPTRKPPRQPSTSHLAEI